jgi:ABC-type Fe3+ transport system, periplasmic component
VGKGCCSGVADIAIANSYYYGYMLFGKAGEDQKKAANNVKMFFPNQNDRGVHINISGLGILKNAKNVDNANRFIEFLLSSKMQASMVNNSFEYPILKNVLPHPDIVISGSDFIEDEILVSEYGKFNSEAIKLMDRAGWK